MALTYTLPAARVFEVFNASPAASNANKSACILGGHAQLVRYAQPAETELGFLGFYDPAEARALSWPNLATAAVVDQGYAKVFVKDALLKYSHHDIGGGGAVSRVANTSNKLVSSALVFGTNATANRSAEFIDRDVRPGDVAVVRGLTGGGASVVLTTYVQNLIAAAVAASVGTAVVDAGNPSTRSSAVVVAQSAGPTNCVSASAIVTAYDGLPSGHIGEVYTAICTQSSVGGDLTTGLLRIVSASGTDDVASVAPAASGSPFALGTRGATMTLTATSGSGCLASAAAAGVPALDVVAGQTFTITVTGAYTAPAPTANSAYTGLTNTVYTATVTRGGKYSGSVKPQITVSTSTGVDQGGPVTVSAASTFVALGSYGTQIEFTGAGLRLGDKFEVPVTAASSGALNGIALGASFDPTVVAASEVELTLYIRKPLLSVPADDLFAPPTLNWTTSPTQITINAGLVATDPTYTNAGVPVPLPVSSLSASNYGRLYVEYRAWLPALAASVGSLAAGDDIDLAIPGPLTPDNPLKYGVQKARAASNGTPVLYAGVVDPSVLNDWIDTLEKVSGDSLVGCVAPMSKDRAVWDLCQAHVDGMSGPDSGLRRTMVVALTGVPKIPIVSAGSTIANFTAATTSDAAVALATVLPALGSSVAPFVRVDCTTVNALFLTNGVRALDTLRIQYTTDGFGGTAWSEYVIASVTSESELVLAAGPADRISSAVKMEVWRTLNATEEAHQIGASAGSFADIRVVALWPDQIEDAGVLVSGMFAAAAFAGLRSGVAPQQGLTKVELPGFTAATRTTRKFNKAQLDIMALAGVCVITQAADTGAVYIRHALTTSGYGDVAKREEMVIRNFDSVADYMQQLIDPFIGRTNVTPTNAASITMTLENGIRNLQSSGTSVQLGPQLLGDSAVLSVVVDPVNADRYIATMLCSLPAPLNNLDLYLDLQI